MICYSINVVLVDEFLTFKDIIGAALIIFGCLIDQVPEHMFVAYSQSCMRWPTIIFNDTSNNTFSTPSHKTNDDSQLAEVELNKYKHGNTGSAYYYNNDDDEEKMRKNVFIN